MNKNKKTNENKTQHDSKKLFILWLILMAILIGADIGLWLLGNELPEMIASISITLFFGSWGIFIVRLFYKDYINPKKTLEKRNDTYLDERTSKIRKRMKGKDMFEIVDNYRKQYFQTMIIVIFMITFLLSAAFILKLHDYDLNIPFYWSILTSVIIVIISIAISYKIDFKFISSEDLKKEIKRHGYDEQRVNNDFMMANYHMMFKGLMAIGQSYYVVFMQNFCRVGNIQRITSIESYSETRKLNNSKVTRYYIRIHENDNTVSFFTCADKIASDLITKDFNLLGFEVIDKGDTFIEDKKNNTKKNQRRN